MRTLQHEAKTSKPNTVAHCYRCYAAMHIFKKAPAKVRLPKCLHVHSLELFRKWTAQRMQTQLTLTHPNIAFLLH